MSNGEMEQHAGEYRVGPPVGGPSVIVQARNGSLYLQMKLRALQPALRLRHYQPGLFVTPDGKPVSFTNGEMRFGDIHFVKAR